MTDRFKLSVPLHPFPTLAQVEAQYLKQAIQYFEGNKTAAAKAIGIDRRTLYRMLERYQIADLDRATQRCGWIASSERMPSDQDELPQPPAGGQTGGHSE